MPRGIKHKSTRRTRRGQRGGQSTSIVVSTLAGSQPGFADGTGSSAKLNYPYNLALDATRNVFVADTGNHLIRKITPEGVVTTIAGTSTMSGFADGTGSSASFNAPQGVAVDSNNNIYVADTNNNRIRKVTPEGVVTTIAGDNMKKGLTNGTGTNASFNSPQGLAVDLGGNIFVADMYNNCIRKITPGGVVTTLAGSRAAFADGTGTDASFFSPRGVAVDAGGNVYVADTGNQRIRKVTPDGVVTTIAGNGGMATTDGPGTSASFNRPYSVAIHQNGNIYVGDHGGKRIRKVTPAGVVTTHAGTGAFVVFTDGPAANATFSGAAGVAIDISGNVYVADTVWSRIRKITGGEEPILTPQVAPPLTISPPSLSVTPSTLSTGNCDLTIPPGMSKIIITLQ